MDVLKVWNGASLVKMLSTTILFLGLFTLTGYAEGHICPAPQATATEWVISGKHVNTKVYSLIRQSPKLPNFNYRKQGHLCSLFHSRIARIHEHTSGSNKVWIVPTKYLVAIQTTPQNSKEGDPLHIG